MHIAEHLRVLVLSGHKSSYSGKNLGGIHKSSFTPHTQFVCKIVLSLSSKHIPNPVTSHHRHSLWSKPPSLAWITKLFSQQASLLSFLHATLLHKVSSLLSTKPSCGSTFTQKTSAGPYNTLQNPA